MEPGSSLFLLRTGVRQHRTAFSGRVRGCFLAPGFPYQTAVACLLHTTFSTCAQKMPQNKETN